jgi:hypothetical protein
MVRVKVDDEVGWGGGRVASAGPARRGPSIGECMDVSIGISVTRTFLADYWSACSGSIQELGSQ